MGSMRFIMIFPTFYFASIWVKLKLQLCSLGDCIEQNRLLSWQHHQANRQLHTMPHEGIRGNTFRMQRGGHRAAYLLIVALVGCACVQNARWLIIIAAPANEQWEPTECQVSGNLWYHHTNGPLCLCPVIVTSWLLAVAVALAVALPVCSSARTFEEIRAWQVQLQAALNARAYARSPSISECSYPSAPPPAFHCPSATPLFRNSRWGSPYPETQWERQ